MVRTKLVALLLGPSGVGLVGLYMSATGLIGTIASMGIGSSGVREVAEAHGSGDPASVARTVKTLRRACWVTGLIGWIITIFLSWPLSVWTFGSGEHAVAIATLGITVLFSSLSSGQTSLLQGTRRIGDIARLNVFGVVAGTVVAVGLYAWLGGRGIVPVLIVTGGINLGFSWWFASKVEFAPVKQTFTESWRYSRRLFQLGFAFMWSGVLTAIVALAIRSLIVRHLGLDANGIYQAAWGISGMFAGFILGAMGTDFYPRLTAAAHDHAQMNRLVNEQTEIGVLLALPGLLGTLAFAPWVMRIFYSAKFMTGAELLPWFVVGIFGQVISWPMGFMLAAKGESRWYILVETTSNALRFVLSIILLNALGLWGTALAMPIMYFAYTALLLWVCNQITEFKWSAACLKLVALSAILIFFEFVVQKILPRYISLGTGAVITVVASLISARGLISRLGRQHRIVLMLCRFPIIRFACGI